jgi:hypothetical protein
MCQRCHNPNSDSWSDWGGRGITVYDAWRGPGGFIQFIADMGEPANAKLQIERRDNNGNYTPDNCYWATRRQQSLNRRNSRRITYKDQTKLLHDWASELKMPYKELHRRIISRKWSVERAFTQPIKFKN